MVNVWGNNTTADATVGEHWKMVAEKVLRMFVKTIKVQRYTPVVFNTWIPVGDALVMVF